MKKELTIKITSCGYEFDCDDCGYKISRNIDDLILKVVLQHMKKKHKIDRKDVRFMEDYDGKRIVFRRSRYK